MATEPKGLQIRSVMNGHVKERLACATRNIVTPLVLAVVMLTECSQARAHDLLADGDPYNDWIQGLANGEKVSCCGTNDCYALPQGAIAVTTAGEFKVSINGSWFNVAEKQVVRDSSPDGRPWVCPERKARVSGFMYSVEGVRCLLLPMLM
jgi:hypothetical protein